MRIGKTSQTPLLEFAVAAAGSLLALVGMLVMAGWHWQVVLLTQIKPSFTPMYYSTALGLLCIGSALLMASRKRPVMALVPATLAGALGLLGLAHSLFGTTRGIEDLLLRMALVTAYPQGAMAPVSAISLVLVALALWLAAPLKGSGHWPLVGILGSLVAGAGLVSILAYPADLYAANSWRTFISSGLHSAISLTVAGAALIAHALNNEARLHIEKSFWRSAATALVTLTVFAGTWQQMRVSEESTFHEKADIVARAASIQIRTALELHVQAIERMAQRAQVRLPTQDEWQTDAAQYMLNAHEAYAAIAWLDPSLQLRWSVPKTLPATPIINLETIKNWFDVNSQDHRLKLVRIEAPANGAAQFLILAPVFQQVSLKGLIIALITPAELFENMQVVTDRNYGFTITSDNQLLFVSNQAEAIDHQVLSDRSWSHSIYGSLDRVNWNVTVWPIDSPYSAAPWFVLLAGIFSAITLSIVVSKSLAVSARSREFWTIIAAAPVGVLVFGLDHRIRKINGVGERLFGYAPSDILGQRIETLVPGVGSSSSRGPALPARFTRQEMLGRRRDGSEIAIEVELNTTLINGEKQFLMAVTDVSERKLAQQQLEAQSQDLLRSNAELRQVQQQLQTTIDHMPSLVGSWDIELRNRFGNRAYQEWFSITPEQLRGKPIWEVIGDDGYSEIKPFLESVLHGNVEVFERSISYADGSLRHAVFSYVPDVRDGEVQGFYSFVSDVTPLKQAQITKENALAQLQGILDAAKDFAIIESNHQGIITLFSRGAEILLGYTAQEMVGKVRIDYFHQPEQLHARCEELSAQLGQQIDGMATIVEPASHGQTAARDWTYVHRDGTPLQVNLTIAAMRDKATAIVGYLIIAKDIREEQKTLNALADARDKAQAANQAKSQFLANMSHEIRTPMNAVLGMLQLLQRSALNAKQLDYVMKTRSAAQALLVLLNDILDFSKVEAGKMSVEQAPFDIDMLLRELSVIFSANLSDKDIEILFSIDRKLPGWLIGDVTRLRQVLINLAGNATKFTPQGAVVITVKIQKQDAQRSTVEFAVQDSGIGIAPDKLEHIFEGFSQAETSTTRRFGGTGLGLAISRHLVELMGGQLAVESTLGAGSRFYFTLTLEHVDADADDRRDTTGSEIQISPQRILIVDDNPVARQVLSEMVTSLGWQATTAASGELAIATLGTTPAPFDIVLLDWKMTDMDGLEVAARMHEHYRHDASLRIIMMATTYGREMLERRLPTQRIVHGFLMKPMTTSMLFDAVIEATYDTSEATTEPSQRRLQGLRLLVVEDTAINQQVARELLSSEGAQVELASDGRAGVARVLDKPQAFDAVLMDIQMPIMDGYAATRELRRHPQCQSLPIIAMTANAMASDKLACREAGMNDHIGKPIDLNDVIQTLLRYCTPRSANPVIKVTETEASGIAPEFEFDAALKRMGGNRTLFARLAAQFSDAGSAVIADFADSLRRQEYTDAGNAMHTLAGLASSIGAVRMAAHASKTEARLRAAEVSIDPNSTIRIFDVLARRTQDALRSLTAQDSFAAAGAVWSGEPGIDADLGADAGADVITDTTADPTADPSADAMRVQQCLAELEMLLRSANMRALPVFSQLEHLMRSENNAQLLTLKQAVNSLDFKRALQCSQALRNSLGLVNQ